MRGQPLNISSHFQKTTLQQQSHSTNLETIYKRESNHKCTILAQSIQETLHNFLPVPVAEWRVLITLHAYGELEIHSTVAQNHFESIASKMDKSYDSEQVPKNGQQWCGWLVKPLRTQCSARCFNTDFSFYFYLCSFLSKHFRNIKQGLITGPSISFLVDR